MTPSDRASTKGATQEGGPDSRSGPTLETPAAASPRISLVVNTRNEEANLPGLLDSVTGVDELVIADMESTDRTLEVARAHGARVLELPNAGCCEPGRQPAIEHATGDWILVLDADERLPPGGLERIRALVASASPEVGGFSFTFHVYVGGTRLLSSGWDVGNEQHPRLFRRGQVTWPPLVHYGPTVQGAVVKVPESDVWIVHRNFQDLHHALEKFNRYSSVEARELVEAGRVPESLEGQRQALDELARRYSPREDGALSLALSFGIGLYRILVQAKAAEMLGWPPDTLPDREALLRGLHALRTEMLESPVLATPEGREGRSTPAPDGWSPDRLDSLLGAPPLASLDLLRGYLERVLGTLREQRAALAEGTRAREELQSTLASVRGDLASVQGDLASEKALRTQLANDLHEEEQRRRDLTLSLDRRSLELERSAGAIARLDREVEELRKALAEATRFTWANLPGKIIGRVRRYSPRKLLRLSRADVRELWKRRRLVRRLSASGLFDTGYYLDQYPDVAAGGWDPVLHYVLHGASEGRNPHPMFDTRYYLDQVPGLSASGKNPLHHFLTRGVKENRRPHPAHRTEDFLGSRFRGGQSSTPESPPGAEGPTPAQAERPPLPEGPPERFTPRALKATALPPPEVPSPSRLLVVSHVLPFPPRAGNEYRIHRQVRHLTAQGHEVVLVVSPLPGPALEGNAVERASAEYRNLIVVQREGTVLHSCATAEVRAFVESLGSERPRSLAEPASSDGLERLAALGRVFCPDHLLDLLTRLDQRLRPDVAICNYVFMSRFLPFLRPQVRKVIDTHDVFSTKSDKVVRFGIADDLAVSGAEEGALLSRADLILAIQPDEREELQAMVPDKEVVTAGVDFDRPASVAPVPSEPVVLLVASDNALNVAGGRDLLSLGWPLIRQRCPGARLLVAGKVCQALEGPGDGVELLGPVDDLDALYARARVVVNPAVAGTGLKIKTLEALAHLRPAVVWPSGIDGLPPPLSRFCEIASNWYEFAEKVAARLAASGPGGPFEHREEIWSELSPEVVYADLDRALPVKSRLEQPGKAQPG